MQMEWLIRDDINKPPGPAVSFSVWLNPFELHGRDGRHGLGRFRHPGHRDPGGLDLSSCRGTEGFVFDCSNRGSCCAIIHV